jgi:hypothetical protein
MTASSMVFFGKYPRIYPCNSHVVNIMILDKYNYVCMEVSRNGTPKSSTLVGISIISHPAIGVPPWIGNPHCSCDVCNICASHLPKSLVRGLCERLCFTGTQVVTVKPLEPSKKASFFDGFSSPNHL